jgi:hypothetical protein
MLGSHKMRDVFLGNPEVTHCLLCGLGTGDTRGFVVYISFGIPALSGSETTL